MTATIRFGLALAMGLGLLTGAALAADSDDSSAASRDPNYVEARKLIDAADYAAAVPLLERVVAADPKNANAHNYLGYSHRKLGDNEAAMRHYMDALAIDREHRGANEYLGELYLEMGQLDKAKERLKVLDGACFFGCGEYRDLKAAIKAYEKQAGG